MGITRSSIINNAVNELGLNLAVDKVPTKLSPVCVPTYDLKPKYSRVLKFNGAAATGTTVIYTTPADKDFYITAVHLTFKHDAANDAAQFYIDVVIDGAQIELLRAFCNVGTAEAQTHTYSFPYPLKVDRNTAVQVVGTWAAGTASRRAGIMGFIVE